MADKIKAFFEKRKGGGKFKGKGHKLTETKPPPEKEEEEYKPIVRQVPTEDARQAGLAALARLEKKSTPSSSFNKSLAFKPSMRAAIAAEMAKGDQPQPVSVEKVNVDPEVLAVQGVYFKCPIISPEILPKNEWKEKIKSFLYEQVETQKGLTSCLMIYTLNNNREEVNQCVETLSTYLSNIVQNPEEEKYKKIRLSNRVFQEKVAKIEGALQFLEAAEFERRSIPFKDAEEEFLVYSVDPVDGEHLEMLIDCLGNAEPVPLELDRNVQVMMPDVASKKVDFPDEFYRLTPEELKKEMQARKDKMETMMQLRTKAMREKEELRELKKYRYTLIRVRFPDGILLQGTFNVYEKAGAVKEFVEEHLSVSGEFGLKSALGQELSSADDEHTLLELRLVPAVLLIFVWKQQEIPESFLDPETLQLLQTA